MSNKHTAASLLLGMILMGSACAQEQLTNGNFESFTSNHVPTSWNFVAGDGSGSQVVGSSPFTNIYPTGNYSFQLSDDTGATVTPWLQQSFNPQSGMLQVSFDFMVPTQYYGNTWAFLPTSSTAGGYFSDLLIGGSNQTFSLQDASGVVNITALASNTWYQVTTTLDLNNFTYSGSISSFGGGALDTHTWSGRSLYSTTGNLALSPQLASLLFSDQPQAGTNNPIDLDNFSVMPATTAVPEPSGTILGFVGMALLGLLRGRGRKVWGGRSAVLSGWGLF
ncbi:MAG: hypothetical protein QM796_01170 [Chthoniobacteraceae bacterium]